MNEQEANEKLRDNEDYYFKLYCDYVTKYVAVVQNPDNLNEYIIEVAVKSGEILYPDHPKNIDYTEFNKDFITENYNRFNEVIKLEIHNNQIQFVDFNAIEKESCINIDCDRGEYDELVSGISVSNEKNILNSGSAGMFFKMNDNSEDIFLLSNEHVLSYGDSKNIVHPSTGDFNPNKPKIIGTLYWDNKDLDAAIAKITHPVKINSYSKAETISSNIIDIDFPKIGMEVRKCGRTTGLTEGIIRSINCTVNLSNEPNCKKVTNKVRNLILTECMTHSGDSGSVIINKDNKIVGLHIGSNKITGSYFVNIKKIFSKKNLPNISFNSVV